VSELADENYADDDEPVGGEAAPAEAEWQPPGREWYDNIGQFVEQAGPILQQLAYQQYQPPYEPDPGYEYGPQPQPQDEYGDYDPDAVRFIEQRIDQRLENMLGPYQPVLGLVAQREAETATRSALDQFAQTYGEFSRDEATMKALQLQQRGHDPEWALQVAAQQQHEFEQRIAQQAVEAYKESLRAVAEAPSEPSASSGAGQEVEPPPRGTDRYEILAQRWVQDRNLSNP